MLVVFDVNVVVSALLLEHSTPGLAFHRGISEGTILLSAALVTEIDDVLRRPKFDQYVARSERERFLAALIRRATLIEINQRIQACRDPKDNHILELAVCGEAEAIVTGDYDLLDLNPFQGIAIVTPGEFLKADGQRS